MSDMETRSTHRDRRLFKNLLLSPQNQLRAGVWMFLHGFLITCLFVAMFTFMASTMMTNLLAMIPSSMDAGAIVESARRDMWVIFGLFIVASFLSSMFLAVKLTHRYLGPMQQARHFVRALTEGRPNGPMKLREGDDFPLEEDLNALARKLYPDL